jgi:hypothetical protein
MLRGSRERHRNRLTYRVTENGDLKALERSHSPIQCCHAVAFREFLVLWLRERAEEGYVGRWSRARVTTLPSVG